MKDYAEKQLSSIKWLGLSEYVMKGIESAILEEKKDLQYGFSFKGENLFITNNINVIIEMINLSRKNLDIQSVDIDIFVNTKSNMRKILKEYKDYSWQDYPPEILEANKKRLLERVLERFKNKFTRGKDESICSKNRAT